MNSYNLENFERPKLTMPNNGKKLLMHSCCAPCAGEIMEAVAASGIDTAIYFYNPNIHPREEYEIRKEENIRFAEKLLCKSNVFFFSYFVFLSGVNIRVVEIYCCINARCCNSLHNFTSTWCTTAMHQ